MRYTPEFRRWNLGPENDWPDSSCLSYYSVTTCHHISSHTLCNLSFLSTLRYEFKKLQLASSNNMKMNKEILLPF